MTGTTKGQNQSKLRLDVLVIENDGTFFGQVLQQDIAVQGSSMLELSNRLSRTIAVRILEDVVARREPLTSLAQAPRRFWEMFAMEKVDVSELPVYVPVDEVMGRWDVHAQLKQVRKPESAQGEACA